MLERNASAAVVACAAPGSGFDANVDHCGADDPPTGSMRSMGGAMACGANGGADGCKSALMASDANVACLHVAGLCAALENTATARGKFGDRNGLGARTDASKASNAARRLFSLTSSSFSIGIDKSHTCPMACAMVASIFERIPGATMAPPLAHTAVSAVNAAVCSSTASNAASPATAPLMSSSIATVLRSSNPSAVACPHAPPFLRFLPLALLFSTPLARALRPTPHGLAS